MNKLALCALLATTTSCSAVLKWDQCNVAADCATTDGAIAYCTADHICVSDVPSDVLCKIDPMSSTDPSAMTIGGLFRLTGENELKDTAISQAASLAVGEINLAGKRLVRLVLCDTNGDPVQARKAMTTVVEDFHAVAIVGPTSSTEVLGLAQQGSSLPEKYEVPVVSGSATSPSISSLGNTVQTPSDGVVSLVWRTCASDAVQARVLAANDNGINDLIPTGTTGVSTAYVNSAYGQGLSGAFSSTLATTFPSIKPPQSAPFDEGTDGTAVVSFLQGLSPQVALIVADSDAPAWVAALAGGGPNLAGTLYLLTDGAKSQALLPANPSSNLIDVFNRTKGTGPGTPSGTGTPSGAVNATFTGAYSGTYKQDPSGTAFVANTYDAVYAIAIASAVVKPGFEVSGTAIAAGLSRLSSTSSKLGNTPIAVGTSAQGTQGTFAAGYLLVSQGYDINLIGASGPIDFDATTGDVLTAPIEIWSIDTTTNPAQPAFVTDTTIDAP